MPYEYIFESTHIEKEKYEIWEKSIQSSKLFLFLYSSIFCVKSIVIVLVSFDVLLSQSCGKNLGK